MCNHTQFYVDAKIIRLTESENTDSPVVGFTAEVKIICLDCKQHFQFIGLQPGWSVSKPMVSIDQLELRAPIKPCS